MNEAIAILEAGIAEGAHPGAQLYASQRGRVLADVALGNARDGVPMTCDTPVLWFSAGKPLTAVAVAQLVERGALDWETPVAVVVPEFAEGGKEAVTLRHVLTHTAGLHRADVLDPLLSWDEKTARVCALESEPEWPPGRRAAYSASVGWHLLGEMVRRVTGREFAPHLRDEVLRPLGMDATFLASESTDAAATGAWVFDTREAAAEPLEFWNTPAAFRTCLPGGSTRGPVRELGRFYEAFLNGGAGVLRPGTIRSMTVRTRRGMFDETFRFETDCGLGFILNSNRGGLQMPYGYGREAGGDAFGHSGQQSSCAFADPERGLVVAWACNGLPGERRHQQRQRAVNDAILRVLDPGNRR
jgi:CubicO group peptidase (beta-lactamase class C family)